MRSLTFIVPFSMLVASASASADVMDNYFGNTVIVRHDSEALYLHYKPDHTFDGAVDGAAGKRQIAGKWDRDDHGRVCRSIERKSGYAWSPIPGAAGAIKDFALGPEALDPACVEISAHITGDSWIESQDGKPAVVKLVAGLKD